MKHAFSSDGNIFNNKVIDLNSLCMFQKIFCLCPLRLHDDRSFLLVFGDLCDKVFWEASLCLSLCLSVGDIKNFNLGQSFRNVRDREVTFGMNIPLMKPFQQTPRLISL